LTSQKIVNKKIALGGDPLSPAQCRMARAALQWSLDTAAKAAGVSYRTIFRLENEERDIQSDKIRAIRQAYEAAGVGFIDDGPDAGGVVPAASERITHT
jgi:DNA-binding XRE family transcriptional regulator